jgi:hypothetical protein
VLIGVAATLGSGEAVMAGEGAAFAQGVLSCIAAGLLLYVGLVEFLGGLLCTVHQDSWSHAVAGGDADHVDHHPSQYHPRTDSDIDEEGPGCLSPPPTPSLQGGINNPRGPLLSSFHGGAVQRAGLATTYTSYGGCDTGNTPPSTHGNGGDDVPMVTIVPSSRSHGPDSPHKEHACSSRGRFLQTLPTGASFPRVHTPHLPKPTGFLTLDESTSLVGLSIASSPLMYSCTGALCTQSPISTTMTSPGESGPAPSFEGALEGSSGTACCQPDCGTQPTHEHQHHHSHSGHQQRHHHHATSCGHVADFHCAHPHIARFAVSGMVGLGAVIMALLATIA